jgi:hypothetical protein
MSFNIYNTLDINGNEIDELINNDQIYFENGLDIPDVSLTLAPDQIPTQINYTPLDDFTINNKFPKITYTGFTNIPSTQHLFNLSYVDLNGQSSLITNWLFDDGYGHTTYLDNENHACSRLFQTGFDISADYSMKIPMGTSITSTLTFKYILDSSALSDFLFALREDETTNIQTHYETGGVMNCVLFDYDNYDKYQITSYATGMILKPDMYNSIPSTYRTSPLEYTSIIKINFNPTSITSPDNNGVSTTKIDLLLKMSFNLIYAFLS